MMSLLHKIRVQTRPLTSSGFIEVIPGLLIILLVVVARLTGSLQTIEKMAFDYLLRSRPAEPLDEQILIVGIDEADIQEIGTYPIPDSVLAEAMDTIQQSEPAVIGLDLFRDLPIGDRPLATSDVITTSDNIIGIERVQFIESDNAVAPLPTLPSTHVGFVNAILDDDGSLRRSLLGASDLDGNFRFSFTIRVAEAYLSNDGLSLDNGTRDSEAMRFGTTEIPRFRPNTGAYVRADASGVQTLVNFRSGTEPFRTVSLAEIQSGQVPEDWMRDRIVLIGVTATSAGDLVNSAAIDSVNPGLNAGITIQAHAISQIINAVLSDRPLLRSWGEGWEYLWIVAWGAIGIGIGLLIGSPIRILVSTALGCVLIVGSCYGAIVLGWWISLVPPLLVLAVNGTMLAVSRFYQHERSLRTRLQERQLTLERTFDALHNGPLQTLARMLRQAREQEEAPFLSDLEVLNEELRSVCEFIRGDALGQDSYFYVNSGHCLDLSQPLHEVLHEVYHHTLLRELPYLQTIKIKVMTFDPIDSQHLSMSEKRGICRFLEEALCNVGKHAKGVTQLTVSCTSNNQWNHIVVQDNGSGLMLGEIDKSAGGRGTQQARNLARQLGGIFNQSVPPSGGMSCELHWPIQRSLFLRFRNI